MSGLIKRGGIWHIDKQVVRRVLNVASSEWVDQHGHTWLETAPKIKLFPILDARSPYPLTREKQALLFQELAYHLARTALFKVNTGLRDQEVCGTRRSRNQCRWPGLTIRPGKPQQSVRPRRGHNGMSNV